MIAKIGWAFLFASFCSFILGFILQFFKAKFIDDKNIITTAFFLCLSAYLTLVLSFVLDKFYVYAVYQYSEVDLDLIYKIAASWSGMHGSLLLWTTVLVLFIYLGVKNFELKKLDSIFIYFSAIFLTGLSLFLVNPFQYVTVSGSIPADGLGLNPLLHNGFMLAHPIFTYLGLNSSVYLVLKNSSERQANKIDNLEAFGWICLTVGIFLGGIWAYLELGWGGYWAWDPVENSSFIPWLSYTAYLHLFKYKAGEKYRKFLAYLTHFFAIFGTFLTRTGFVQSVHTFSNSEMGWYLKFYVFFALILTFYNFLTAIRKQEKTQNRFELLMSLQTLTFVFYALSILWGVLYGPLADLLFGEQVILGIPFFDAISLPYWGILLSIMPFGFLYRSSGETRGTLVSVIASFIIAIKAYWSFDSISSIDAIFITIFCFNTICYTLKLFRSKTRDQVLLLLVHFFVILTGVGIFFSYNKKIEINLRLERDNPKELFNHIIVFKGIEVEKNRIFEEVKAKILIDNKLVKPASRYYFKKNQVTAEIGLVTEIKKDIYISLVEIAEDGETVAVKVYFNPWVILVWLGITGLLVSYTLYRIHGYFRL